MSKSRYQPSFSLQSQNTDYWDNALNQAFQKDAVQPRSVDSSMFDQINSIMNGKPKYPSVQAAVEDMKERSGLTAYLTKLNKTSSEEDLNVKKASNNEVDHLLESCKQAIKQQNWHDLGKFMGEMDRLSNDPSINGVESIRLLKYFKDPEIKSVKVPMDSWTTYTVGYGIGAKKSEESKTKDVEFTENVIRHLSKKASSEINILAAKIMKLKQASEDKPEIFKQCPQVKRTFENYIRDSRGNLPVPAIIDKIKSIHKNDVSDNKYWEDDDLIREVSRLNLLAKKDNPDTYQHYSNLGSQDRSMGDDHIDPSNTDAFHALMPIKL